ncbi:GbsR/MarR family transcriptional regulator [Luteirhabdus pelagi]|uniref:GbsR/MarR family transcriptional regulator n=1 Tax=Luteirhabdus pelagi TaxID=2792783 RepID=UPI001939A6AF|nr:ArsR family transcriptional regulator [Luteirhabdus pelagi]MCT8339253.1 ArsR family transcriptional regulator [Thermobacterium salinum]
MAICSEEKKKLIEETGLHFEVYGNLPPLAARIFATALLSKEEGYSFDEIMQITQASKSSVSTSLNLLIQLRYLEYYTKSGERKRYYRNGHHNLRGSLEDELRKVTKKVEVIKKIDRFNKEHNLDKFKKNKSIGNIFLDYLENQKQNLKETIDKITEFEKNHTS